jgi:thiopeptide-type bacteriocin biosynthesis protein
MHVSDVALLPWPQMTHRPEPEEDWLSVRIACRAEEADAVLLDLVAPLTHRLWRQGLIGQGFFLRYQEGGHHLRVRFAGAHSALFGPARALIDACIQAYVAGLGSREIEPLDRGPEGMRDSQWQPLFPAQALRPTPSYEYQRYEPEVERYGGPRGLHVSECHFAASSAMALHILARERAGRGSRRAAALLLLHASALGFQLDGRQRAESFEQFYLRRQALAWRTPPERESLEQAYARQRASLHLLVPADPSARRFWQPVGEPWQGSIAQTCQALCHLQEQALLSTSLLALLSAYIHMLCNRLGIYLREETGLCYFLARLYAEHLAGGSI